MDYANYPITASVDKWCELSGLGKTKTYEEIAKGRIESFTVGRKRLIKVASSLRNLEEA